MTTLLGGGAYPLLPPTTRGRSGHSTIFFYGGTWTFICSCSVNDWRLSCSHHVSVDHPIMPDQRKQYFSAVSLHAFISIFSVSIPPDTLPSSTLSCFPPFIDLHPSFSHLQLLNPHFFRNPISCRNRLSPFFLFIQFIFFFPQAFSLPAASNLSDLFLLLPSFFSPPLYSLSCSSSSLPLLFVSVYSCCQLWCGAKKQLREIKLCLNKNCRSTLQAVSRRLGFLISMNAP